MDKKFLIFRMPRPTPFTFSFNRYSKFPSPGVNWPKCKADQSNSEMPNVWRHAYNSTIRLQDVELNETQRQMYFLRRDSSNGIVTRLWAGRSGVWTLAESKEFSIRQNVNTVSGVHPDSYSMDTEIISRGWSDWGAMLTDHLHPVSILRVNGGTPLLPLHAFMAWKGRNSRSS